MRAWVLLMMSILATAASVLLSLLLASAVMSATALTVEVALRSSLFVAVTLLEPWMSTFAVELATMKASLADPTDRLAVFVSIVESASRVMFFALRSPSTVTVAWVASAAKFLPSTPMPESDSDAFSVTSWPVAVSDAPEACSIAASDSTLKS